MMVGRSIRVVMFPPPRQCRSTRGVHIFNEPSFDVNIPVSSFKTSSLPWRRETTTQDASVSYPDTSVDALASHSHNSSVEQNSSVEHKSSVHAWASLQTSSMEMVHEWKLDALRQEMRLRSTIGSLKLKGRYRDQEFELRATALKTELEGAKILSKIALQAKQDEIRFLVFPHNLVF
jgi:hypothetical protein